MVSDCLSLEPAAPEWRRSGPFLLAAIALHALILFYPLKLAIEQLAVPPAGTVMVRLVETPPAPAAAPPQAPPQPARPPVSRNRERPPPTPRPVLAMSSEQAAPSPTFSVPAPSPSPPVAAAAVAPAQPAVSAAPVPVTAAHFDAAYLQNLERKYPPLSRRLGEEGKVLLRVLVSKDGRPAAVNVEKSSNFERLDEAARQAVASWRFSPAKRGDEAIEASIIVPIVFRLEG